MTSLQLLIRGASVLGLVVLLSGCAGAAPADPGASSSPGTGQGESAADDPRLKLADSMLTVTDFPIAGWVVEDTQVTPYVEPPAPSAPPTVSQGTGPTEAAPEKTLCADGDLSQISELDSEGVFRTFRPETSPATLAEGLLFDESGELAESIRAQIEACIDAGPVDIPLSSGITATFTWTTDGLPASDVFTAQFSSVGDLPLQITMFSVAHVDGVTMVALAKTKDLRTILEPEEFVSIAEAAVAKLG